MNEPQQPPRWTVAFLRALERAGDVRASAEDAGIDHTTVYLRRRAHGDFAEAWDAALKAHSARVEEQRMVELEALTEPSTNSSPSDWEELVGSRFAAEARRA